MLLACKLTFSNVKDLVLPYIFENMFFRTCLSAELLLLNTVMQPGESNSRPRFLEASFNIRNCLLALGHLHTAKLSDKYEGKVQNVDLGLKKQLKTSLIQILMQDDKKTVEAAC